MIAPRVARLLGRLKLLSGVTDAGFASLGTFLAGVVAVRELPAVALAVYVVLSSATIFTMPLPRQLVYFPALIGSNVQQQQVAPVIRRATRRAVRPSAAAALVVVVSALPLLGRMPATAFTVLTLTAIAFGWVSPLQDFLRGSLHVVGRHGSAAVCSIVLAAVVAAVTLSSVLIPLPLVAVAALPFGSLLLGNLASIAVARLLLRGARRHDDYVVAGLAERSRYLFIELVIQGSWFACNYIVLGILGADALARLETARITASPVLILATGVSTFMLAALLRQISADEQDGARSRRLLVRALTILLVGAALYAAALVILLPVVGAVLNREVDPVLAVTRIGSYALEGCSNLVGSVLLAIGASKTALVMSAVAGAIGLAGTAALSPVIGPIALPVSQATGMATRLVVSIGASRDRFRERPRSHDRA